MSRSLEYVLTELRQQIQRIGQVGTVCKVQANPLRYKVKFDDNRESDWLRDARNRAGEDKGWNVLTVGEQVSCLFPGGGEQGQIIGTLNSDKNPQPHTEPEVWHYQFADGAVIEYDRKNHKLKAILPEGATTELVSTGGITITGDVHVNGNIKATEDITDKTRSMEADRAIYNGHKHPGVSPGQGTTATPEAQQ